MAKIKCFHCHRTLPSEEVISHASAKHPSEDLAILLHDGQNHFIPKVYNWKPIISVGTEVYLEEGTYKLIRRSTEMATNFIGNSRGKKQDQVLSLPPDSAIGESHTHQQITPLKTWQFCYMTLFCYV